MLYKELKAFMQFAAEQLKMDAAYSGAHNDGGKQRLIMDFEAFKQSLVEKHDLRPSEYYKLDGMDVEVPQKFQRYFERYETKFNKAYKLKNQADLLNFYKWFFEEADFGPAHDDVMEIYYQRYKSEKGVDVKFILDQTC